MELKRRLLRGQLPTGTILSQRQLARLLGTSNTPVRSAMERLESEGLLRIEPRRGVVLRELEPREVAELYEIRLALESYAMGQVAGRLSGEQVRLLEQSLERQRRALAAGELTEIVEADAEFHLLVCGFLGNREIVGTLTRLGDQIRRVILRVTSVFPRRMAESVAEHEGIAAALLAGDGALAAARVREHLWRGRELMAPGEGTGRRT